MSQNNVTHNTSTLGHSSAEETSTVLRESRQTTDYILRGKEGAQQEALGAREEAMRSRIDIYSNEKAQEQQRQYEEYIHGSVAQNFETRTRLFDEELALRQMRADAEIQILRRTTEADLEIARRQAEADIQLQKTKREINEAKMATIATWLWRIGVPVVSIISGILAGLIVTAVM